MTLDKSALLSRIRVIQKAVDSLMDSVMSMADTQPEQPAPVRQASMTDADGWMTAKQTCRCLKISETTFYEYIRQGLLPPGLEFGPRFCSCKCSCKKYYLTAKEACAILILVKAYSTRKLIERFSTL